MKTKIYAAYGSNMNIEQMRVRCPDAKVIGTGTLKDYKLTFRGTTRGVANIEKKSGSNVPIVLWEITPKCEKALDIYEGYPRLYVKQDIDVVSEKGIIKAMAYVMTPKYTKMAAQPAKYYFSVIADGYFDNGIDLKPLETAYVECLSELRKGR
ncbi:MAG TPA: gamma-glutamylcyclotransferase [Lachnospiraceae bacterium]|nr:gamma-glutamylcyclotransferase [Lachnospiraceae bacterium]